MRQQHVLPHNIRHGVVQKSLSWKLCQQPPNWCCHGVAICTQTKTVVVVRCVHLFYLVFFLLPFNFVCNEIEFLLVLLVNYITHTHSHSFYILLLEIFLQVHFIWICKLLIAKIGHRSKHTTKSLNNQFVVTQKESIDTWGHSINSLFTSTLAITLKMNKLVLTHTFLYINTYKHIRKECYWLLKICTQHLLIRWQLGANKSLDFCWQTKNKISLALKA